MIELFVVIYMLSMVAAAIGMTDRLNQLQLEENVTQVALQMIATCTIPFYNTYIAGLVLLAMFKMIKEDLMFH